MERLDDEYLQLMEEKEQDLVKAEAKIDQLKTQSAETESSLMRELEEVKKRVGGLAEEKESLKI